MEEKSTRHLRFDDKLRTIIRVMEYGISVVTLLALIAALIVECCHMLTDFSYYYTDVNHLLHNLLDIVVGLEFVKMLIDTTPAHIMEVLGVAITRHVVLSHEDPWSNLLSILCIAILFVVHRYVIRPRELQEDLGKD